MTQREEFEAWVTSNPGASEAYDKWSTGQPFRTDLATWHAFRTGAEWKSQTEPLGFQTRRAIRAEDEAEMLRRALHGACESLKKAADEKEAAQPAQMPGWIAVADRLPEPDVRVLVWRSGRIFVSTYWRNRFISDSLEQPTHWIPLPHPPITDTSKEQANG